MREENDEFSAAARWLVGVTFGGKLCVVSTEWLTPLLSRSLSLSTRLRLSLLLHDSHTLLRSNAESELTSHGEATDS